MSCTTYQPLPISTGTVGIDRCGNIEVYAAPTVVRAHVDWGCWPIQSQQPGWPPWGCWGGPGWGGGGAPWWWLPHPAHPIELPWGWWNDWQAVMAQGAPMANWMIGMMRGQRAARRA